MLVTCKWCQLVSDSETDESGPTCPARGAIYRPAERYVPTLQLRDATLTASHSQSGRIHRTPARHPCQVSAVTTTQCVGGQCGLDEPHRVVSDHMKVTCDWNPCLHWWIFVFWGRTGRGGKFSQYLCIAGTSLTLERDRRWLI